MFKCLKVLWNVVQRNVFYLSNRKLDSNIIFKMIWLCAAFISVRFILTICIVYRSRFHLNNWNTLTNSLAMKQNFSFVIRCSFVHLLRTKNAGANFKYFNVLTALTADDMRGTERAVQHKSNETRKIFMVLRLQAKMALQTHCRLCRSEKRFSHFESLLHFKWSVWKIFYQVHKWLMRQRW